MFDHFPLLRIAIVVLEERAQASDLKYLEFITSSKNLEIFIYGVIALICWLKQHGFSIKLHFPIVPIQTINIEPSGAVLRKEFSPFFDRPWFL